MLIYLPFKAPQENTTTGYVGSGTVAQETYISYTIIILYY